MTAIQVSLAGPMGPPGPPAEPVAVATGARPTGAAVGTMIFDTTLGKPLWWKGSSWVDATGATV